MSATRLKYVYTNEELFNVLNNSDAEWSEVEENNSIFSISNSKPRKSNFDKNHQQIQKDLERQLQKLEDGNIYDIAEQSIEQFGNDLKLKNTRIMQHGSPPGDASNAGDRNYKHYCDFLELRMKNLFKEFIKTIDLYAVQKQNQRAVKTTNKKFMNSTGTHVNKVTIKDKTSPKTNPNKRPSPRLETSVDEENDIRSQTPIKKMRDKHYLKYQKGNTALRCCHPGCKSQSSMKYRNSTVGKFIHLTGTFECKAMKKPPSEHIHLKKDLWGKLF